MFGWRKSKNEDFEWHRYVRTTILLRRQQRREKIVKARHSAADAARSAARHSRSAIRAGAHNLARGSARLARLSAHGAVTGFNRLSGWLAATLRRIATTIDPVLRKTGQALLHLLAAVKARIAVLLTHPMVRSSLGLIGLLAGLAAVWQWITHGDGPQARTAAVVSLVTLVLVYGSGLRKLLPRGFSLSTPLWLLAATDRLKRLGPPAGALKIVGPGMIVLAAGFITWNGLQALPSLMPSVTASFSSLTSSLPVIGKSEPIVGRARALSGDLLKIDDKIIRLSGIESPVLNQRCKRGRRRSWRCGRTARRALARLVRRRTIRCQRDGQDDHGRIVATCHVGKTNINATMVANGYVFAENGLFAAYSSEEAEARRKKRGIWRGIALRPADYRAKIWDEARQRAPNGCPIKGNVTRRGKVYVMPWASNYRRVRISKSRGERWFCSEQAARAAGWQSADRS